MKLALIMALTMAVVAEPCKFYICTRGVPKRGMSLDGGYDPLKPHCVCKRSFITKRDVISHPEPYPLPERSDHFKRGLPGSTGPTNPVQVPDRPTIEKRTGITDVNLPDPDEFVSEKRSEQPDDFNSTGPTNPVIIPDRPIVEGNEEPEEFEKRFWTRPLPPFRRFRLLVDRPDCQDTDDSEQPDPVSENQNGDVENVENAENQEDAENVEGVDSVDNEQEGEPGEGVDSVENEQEGEPGSGQIATRSLPDGSSWNDTPSSELSYLKKRRINTVCFPWDNSIGCRYPRPDTEFWP